MITRRAFVRAGSLALVSFGLDPLFLDRAAYALGGRRVAGSRTLVCLFQRGAVDGLSMVIPHADPRYYRERPRIAIPRTALIDLDGGFGFHPALAPLEPLWSSGTLAVVHAVGSPNPTRSHFNAQDFMESGTPESKATRDGWANRYCQHHREHAETPFRAVAFGPELPRALAGSAPSLAIDDLRTFGLRTRSPSANDRLTRAFEDLYQGSATGLMSSSSAEAFDAIRMLREANPSRLNPEHGAEYPRGRLGASLMQVAQLIKAKVGLELAFVDVGGWDTHVNQGTDDGQLARRLGELGQALRAFTSDLGERMADVVVLTMSEFGRTVRENGTGGTDHGHGTAMLVLGGNVKGRQVAGEWPGLDSSALWEGRDLAVTTDFRALFGEVLTGHLGAKHPDLVFPGFDPSQGASLNLFGS